VRIFLKIDFLGAWVRVPFGGIDQYYNISRTIMQKIAIIPFTKS